MSRQEKGRASGQEKGRVSGRASGGQAGGEWGGQLGGLSFMKSIFSSFLKSEKLMFSLITF